MRFVRTALVALGLTALALPATALSASAATVPGTPTNVSASTVAGSSTISVSYTAASSDGGAAVDDYKTCAYVNGSTNTNICIDTSTYTSPVSFSVVAPSYPGAGSTFLVFGQPYTFKVKEHNSVGYGSSSSPMASPVTATHAAEAPTNVVATAAKNALSVTWAPGDNDGSALTSQQVSVADVTTSTNLGTHTVSGTATSDSWTGLTGGHQYSVSVQGTNALGSSLWTGSNTVSVTQSLPADVLDLTNWKITLPTGTAGSPTEVTQPSLATYSDSNFFATSDGKGVTFKAAVDGTTTGGSSYPRSELREMNGSSLASWGVNDGKTHTMTVTGSVDVLPGLKPQTVIGQIHDSSSDVIEILGDGVNAATGQTDITFRYNGSTQSTHLITNYTLGTSFTFQIVAASGQYKIYANSVLKATITDANNAHAGLYFKAGNYTQANTSNGTGYGQTTITALNVTHV